MLQMLILLLGINLLPFACTKENMIEPVSALNPALPQNTIRYSDDRQEKAKAPTKASNENMETLTTECVDNPGATPKHEFHNVNKPSIRGTVAPIEITHNRKYVSNRKFSGRAYLMFNHTGIAALKDDVSATCAEAFALPLKTLGGDGFNVHNDTCVYRGGGLLLSRRVRISPDDTQCGAFSGEVCAEKVKFFHPYWHHDQKDFKRTGVKCLKEDCDYEFNQRKRRYTFSFSTAVVEISPIKPHCSDANEHRVIIKDNLGGKLRIKNVLSVSVVEHDADGDGKKELYILSALACARWLKVIKVVI